MMKFPKTIHPDRRNEQNGEAGKHPQHQPPRQHKIIEQQTRAGVLFQSIGFSEVMILKCAFNN